MGAMPEHALMIHSHIGKPLTIPLTTFTPVEGRDYFPEVLKEKIETGCSKAMQGTSHLKFQSTRWK